jgi:hypothetical protein
MTWGGLRGAVGIALALSLFNNVKGSPDIAEEAKRMSSQVIFHVGGLAFLTLTINGLTSAALLRKLELTGTSEARKHVLNNVHDKAVFAAQRALERAIETERFSCANRQKVMSLVPALQPVYKRIEQERERAAVAKKLAKLKFAQMREDVGHQSEPGGKGILLPRRSYHAGFTEVCCIYLHLSLVYACVRA